MPQSRLDLANHQMLALSRTALGALRAALLQSGDLAGATSLQEAGFVGSEPVFQAFRDWMRGRIDAEPGEPTLDEFAELASDYFREAGWGTLRMDAIEDAVAV